MMKLCMTSFITKNDSKLTLNQSKVKKNGLLYSNQASLEIVCSPHTLRSLNLKKGQPQDLHRMWSEVFK